ncbi:MAG: potassium transporter TrkG [Pseudomonadota bacterium]
MNTAGPTADARRQGQAAVAVRARPRTVFRALGKHAPVLALPVGVPGLGAVIEGEGALATALLLPTAALIAVAIWARFWAVTEDLRRIEAVVTLALIFVVSTLAATPAFIVLGMPVLDAVFEAASGITTTGLSVASNSDTWPVSAHLLRGWLQWCGGVVVAVAGVALLMDSQSAAQVLGKEAVGRGDDFGSTRAKARVVLTVYCAITLIAMAIAIPLFPGWWEGPMIVLAAVSTGGFAPRGTSLAEYSLAAQGFAIFLCVATAISLLFYAVAWRRGPRIAWQRGTVPVTLAALASGATLYTAAQIFWQDATTREAYASLLNYLSAQTTAGFSAGPVTPVGPITLILVAAMLLGGDIGSTTGGLKTARTMVLSRIVRLVFLRLRMPNRALSHLRVGDKRADDEAVLMAAALLSIYLVAALILWGAFYADGHPVLPALFDAVSALSCVGLSTGVIGPDLAPHLKTMTILAMFLGRLEFFVFIALFLPSTWLSRR